MTSACPFSTAGGAVGACPVKHDARRTDDDNKSDQSAKDSAKVTPKCPFGYDSQTFKLGPFSCIICQALLFESSKCLPCSHKYCKACISQFKDCPICGADIETIEPDVELQALVDRFIEGHCRIRRSQAGNGQTDLSTVEKKVMYEDAAVERGSFLVQQAMRAFHAKNIESAKSRLNLCSEDIRNQLNTIGSTSDLCSQLGAVLGMMGDCCRASGDFNSAVSYYEESVEFLSKLPSKDLEVVQTLSVSLNKIGDLKYYEGDLRSARQYYVRSLDIRQNSIKEQLSASSQAVDLAISLAKVADVDRALGNEKTALNGFQEAVKYLEDLDPNSIEASVEQKRRSVLDFLRKQIGEKSPAFPAT